MTKKAKSALETIRRTLESETAPSRLSKEEYLEVIEELATDLNSAMDCTRQEIAEEEGKSLTKGLTCENCRERATCPFVDDAYNTGGDCLAMK